MPSPQPFTIDVPTKKIISLQQKLSLADFPDELKGADWDLGCPLSEIKRLAKGGSIVIGERQKRN
jgi:hypothetical protein